jgi:small neutral amino acid transporter SnatA (MarC family)
MLSEFSQSAALLLVLLNPFLVIIYLVDVIRKFEGAQFRNVMIRAGLIAGSVFSAFALLGDRIFSNFIQADFASFQIFGGIVFLTIGLQFVFQGSAAIEGLRGESAHVAGAIAMPVLIGPGTISASVVIGQRHDPLLAIGVIWASVTISIGIMVLLKRAHDWVRPRREPLIERYIEVAGRITALIVGTISVQMIMQGAREWAAKF